MHVSNTHLYSRNSACAWRFLLCLRVGSPLAKTLLGGLDAKPFYGSHLKCLIRLDPFLNSIIAYDDWRERGAWQKGGKVLHICQRLSARAPKAPVICDTPTAALFNARFSTTPKQVLLQSSPMETAVLLQSTLKNHRWPR